MGEMLDNIKYCKSEVIGRFGCLCDMGIPSKETVRKVDACVAVTRDMIQILSDHLYEIAMSFDSDQEKEGLKALRNNDYAKQYLAVRLS